MHTSQLLALTAPELVYKRPLGGYVGKYMHPSGYTHVNVLAASEDEASPRSTHLLSDPFFGWIASAMASISSLARSKTFGPLTLSTGVFSFMSALVP